MIKVPKNISSKIKQKFSVRDNTFSRDVKENIKDRIQLEIGDSKTPTEFLPQAKIMRWDNEVNFSLRWKNDHLLDSPQLLTENDKIKFKKGKQTFQAYELNPSDIGEDGGLEIEVVLEEKPISNVIEFTFQTKELDFFYQPQLTNEEIKRGRTRPDHVLGSYAVYRKNKGGMIDGMGMEYKTNKVFHIYRPKVTDANGVEIWGELNIDEKNGLLTVSIDQEWLDKAVYPVIVDPTFGYTSAGGSNFSVATQDSEICRFALSENGTVASMSIYSKANAGGTLNVKSLIYDDDGGSNEPGTLLASSSPTGINSTTEKWWDFTISASLVTSSYYLGFVTDTASSPSVRIYYDSGSNLVRYKDNNNYASPSNPWGSSDDAFEEIDSVYATYDVPTEVTKHFLSLLGVGK